MAKTIKIIDLLNKIANGEEVPKKIKYEDIVFIWSGTFYHHFDEDDCIHESLSDYLDIAKADLNIVVEIIEDEQEIDIQDIEDVNLFDNGQNFNDMPIIIKSYDDNFTNINNTINKLVQAVKYLDYKLKEK